MNLRLKLYEKMSNNRNPKHGRNGVIAMTVALYGDGTQLFMGRVYFPKQGLLFFNHNRYGTSAFSQITSPFSRKIMIWS